MIIWINRGIISILFFFPLEIKSLICGLLIYLLFGKKKKDKVVREIIKKKGEIGVECGDEGKK